MNIDSFLEDMMREKQPDARSDDSKAIFDQILAKVPNFKQAMFLFEAKDGVFGPVSYSDESMRQSADMEDGTWFLNTEKSIYEFREDYDQAIDNGCEEASSYDVGCAVAEILNTNNDALVRALFGNSKATFSDGSTLTNGTLEVGIVPQDSSVDLGEDDSGRACYLSEGLKGISASFTSTLQFSNAVMVP